MLPRYSRFIASAFLLGLGGTRCSYAQRPRADTTQVKAKSVQLDSVRIEAQRVSTDLTSIKTGEVTGAALDATRGAGLAESLRSIAGVDMLQSGPSIAKPVIHGLHSNRILILNNGVRHESQQWGSEHAPEIDPFIATRLSVLRGAGALRYGGEALGGVVVVEPGALPVPTKNGGVLNGEVNLVGATNNYLRVASGMLHGAFGGKLTGLALHAQGTYKRAGFTRAPAYYLSNTAFGEENFSFTAGYTRKRVTTEAFYSRFASTLGIFSGAHVGSLEDMLLALERAEPLRQPAYGEAIGRPYQTVLHQLVKLKLGIELGSAGSLSFITAWQKNQRAEYDFYRLDANANRPQLYLDVETATADAVWNHPTLLRKLNGQLGVTFMAQSNVYDYALFIPNFQNYAPGVFFIEKYVTGRWLLEAGLRYDYRWFQIYSRDRANGNAIVIPDPYVWHLFSASVGAQYRATENLTWYINAGTAGRAPSINELSAFGVHQSLGRFERGNAANHPEQNWQISTSIDYESDRLDIEAGLYANYIQGFIYSTPDTTSLVLPDGRVIRGAIFTPRGTALVFDYRQENVLLYGADLTLHWRPLPHWHLDSKTSLLLHHSYTTGQPLVLMPPARSEFTLRYEREKIGALRAPYVSMTSTLQANQWLFPRDRDFSGPPQGAVLLGAEVGFGMKLYKAAQADKEMRITLTGSNLLNVLYRNYLNAFRYFTDEMGTNITLRLKIPV